MHVRYFVGMFDMTMPTVLGKKSATGSFDLFVGIVARSFILAIGAIIVGRLLGSAFYGLYALSLAPASFIGLFVGFGMRNATVKFAAQHDHRNEQRAVKETIILGLSSTTLFGGLLSILCFSLSNSIAALFWRIDARFLIQLMSLTIFSDALVVATQSVFVGLERTRFYSSIIVLRAGLQTILEPLLILMAWPASSFGALGCVVGYAIASFATCAVGLALVYFLIIKKLGPPFAELQLWKRFKTMFHYGIPLYVSRIVEGFLSQASNILMGIFASNTLIGNYQVSFNFTVLITFFAVPIATVLFPAFSKIDFKEDAETLRKVFRASVKYTSLLIIPATTLVVVLSRPLVSTLYGATYELAPFFLSLSALIFLYAGLGQFSISALLNGQGETRKNMILGLANVAVGLPLAVVLVPRFQIVGLIAASVISGFPRVTLGSIWVKNLYNASVDWIALAKIFLLSLIVGLTTFGCVNLFSLPSWVQLLVGSAVLSTIFLVLVPLFGVVNSDDIKNLRTIFAETGAASKVLCIPLKIMSNLCR